MPWRFGSMSGVNMEHVQLLIQISEDRTNSSTRSYSYMTTWIYFRTSSIIYSKFDSISVLCYTSAILPYNMVLFARLRANTGNMLVSGDRSAVNYSRELEAQWRHRGRLIYKRIVW